MAAAPEPASWRREASELLGARAALPSWADSSPLSLRGQRPHAAYDGLKSPQGSLVEKGAKLQTLAAWPAGARRSKAQVSLPPPGRAEELTARLPAGLDAA